MHKAAKLKAEATPSFAKKDSGKQQPCTGNNSDCDFSDDLIDEHAGTSQFPFVMSPTQSSPHESSCRPLQSLDNIENMFIHNQHPYLYVPHFCGQNPKSGPSLIQQQNGVGKPVQRHKVKTSNKQSRLQQNINQHLLRRERKLKELKQFLEVNEMKECTFTPATHQSRQNRTPQRNLEQFLKNQSDHVDKIDKKRENIRKKKEEMSRLEESFRPKINKNPNCQMQRNRNKLPAHERLYQVKERKTPQSKNGGQAHQNLQKTAEIKMKANSTRIGSWQLYEDAKRRNNLMRSIEKNKLIDADARVPNRNNQKYGAQKFIKQFCYVLQCMNLLPSPTCFNSADPNSYQSQEVNITQEFNLDQLYGIMRALGFLFYEQNCQNQLACKERDLISEGYAILQHHGVNIRNICVFLLCILGIFNVNPMNFYDSKRPNNGQRQFEPNEKQGRRLHQHFDLLYRNYLIASSRQKKLINPQKGSPRQGFSHVSPRHDQHTKHLAQRYRNKMIERTNQRFISNNIDIVLPTQNNLLAHEDLLVIDSLSRNLEMKRLRENKQSFIDEQCTFYPRTNASAGKNQCQTDRGVSKCRELFEYARTKQQLVKHNRSVNVKDDQNHGVSQFSNISRQTMKTQNDIAKTGESSKQNRPHLLSQTKQNQCMSYARDVDKTVARMLLGRKQRELKNKLLQRGEPEVGPKRQDMSAKRGHSKSTNLQVQMCGQQELSSVRQGSNDEPFLVIDINMGEETDQIEFRSGDEKRVGRIVDEFCVDHDLDTECKEQLLQLVQIQMARYLNNMGAQSTEC